MSLRYWIYLVSAVCALAAAPEQIFAQGTGDPRVGIAIHFVIEAESVKERLRDDLPLVAKAMESSLKLALREYGFLNWNAPSNRIHYTMIIRVVEAHELIKAIQLEVAAHGPDVVKAAPVSLPFEGFMVRKNWSPQVVADEWAERIDEIVHTQRSQLVSSVLGLTPLLAEVKLYPKDLTANVRVQPYGIRASTYPPPKFLVRATLIDPGPPLETKGFAELALGGCNHDLHNETYVCDIEGIAYKGRKMKPATEYQKLMEKAEIEVHSLHVREYWPDEEQVNQNMIAGVTSQ